MAALKKFRWLRQQSLAKQLLLGFSVSLVTVGVATLWVNYGLIRTDLEEQAEKRAQAIAQSLEFASEGALELNNRSVLRRVVQNYSTLPAVLEVAIVNPDGIILAHSSLEGRNRRYVTVHPELKAVMEQASQSGVEANAETKVANKSGLAHILPFSGALFEGSSRRGLAIAIVDLNQMQQDAEMTFVASTVTLLLGMVLILLLMGALIQRIVLRPLKTLNDAVAHSKKTGTFSLSEAISAREIQFLATTFASVIRQLEAYDQLKSEIAQRKQVEADLRDSEARERHKSQELELALQELGHAQAHLVQSEKMSSLGQLVAGVAHEINNPVNFIHGNIQYAHEYMQDILELLVLYQTQYPQPTPVIATKTVEIDLDFVREDLPRLLASMKVGADRIQEIVKSLRAFSRLDEAEVKDVDIHEGIDSTLMILHNRLKAKSDHPGIQVVKQYGDLPKIECYAGQLNQVFMNILSNAIDAIEEITARKVAAPTPTTNPSPSEQQTTDQHHPTIWITTELVQANQVRISIADNGPGIPEHVQKRLFDPFFTTKSVGKGTGMGMSISHQVVTERHQGKLSCISVPGNGATFIIEIPVRLSGPAPSQPIAQ